MDFESKSQLRKHLALVGGRMCAEEDQSRRWRRATDGNAAESLSIGLGQLPDVGEQLTYHEVRV